VNPLAGQDEHETLETLFKNVDLSFAKAGSVNLAADGFWCVCAFGG
jgi:hypothetical protein